MSSDRVRKALEGLVVLGGVLALGSGINNGGLSHVPLAAVFVFVAALSVAFLLPFPMGMAGTSVHSVDFPISFSVLLLFGPTTAGLMSAATCWIAPVRLGRAGMQPWFLWMLVVNASTTILSTFAAGFAFEHLGGVFFEVKVGSASLLPALLAACTLICVHVVLMSADLALRMSSPVLRTALQTLCFSLPSSMLLTPFSLVIACFYPTSGVLALVPFLLPLFAAWHWMTKQSREWDLYRQTVEMLGHAMHRFHQYTSAHEEAVADFSVRIARKMQLPPETIIYLRYAGLLHDIGKIAWGERLLDKSTPLSPEEIATIRRHPNDSADCISRMRHFAPIVPWVRHHHERFDGGGYPDRLAGDGIPMGAAIITVADSFHAMQSPERPYKRPLTAQEALEEVQRCSGTQFNPQVADALALVVAEMT
ncbi:MAG TPA: HD domain-containing phosphohydrolase [Armatimonadota bacterium]|jgi:HD-GYP domain-containing protein (c-di-GMP phosphodiesterase class II)